MIQWTIRYLPEAIQDLKQLDQSVRPEVLKAIRKVAQNPIYPDGYGKPLGNTSDANLAGLFKIKFRKAGLRAVYGLEYKNNTMVVIIVSVRADKIVYKEAERRRLKYNL